MEENNVKEMIINGEGESSGHGFWFPTGVQIIITVLFILFLLISKSCFEEIYKDIREQYRVRMFDSVYADIDESREGLVELD